MHETTHIDPFLGTTLGGRYLLRERVAEGQRWRRYVAETEGRRALLTTLSATLLDDEALSRVLELCGRLAALEHAYVSPLLDFGRDPGGALYIVEPGELWHDLAHELELKGALHPPRCVELVQQLLEGLGALHSAGLTHGGLCPQLLRLQRREEASRAVIGVAPLGLVLEAAFPRANEEALPYQPLDRCTGVAADLFAAARILELLLSGESDPLFAEAALMGRDEALPVGVATTLERALGGEEPFVSAAEMASALGGDDTPTFGRYTLLHRLARGGMGEIFLARAEGIEGIEGTSRLCVIKTIRSNLASDAELVERFVAEVRVLATLSHGNIVPVYDVGRVGDTFYIAMEYVAGKDLHQLLRRAREQGQRLPTPLALFIARELANGLAYAHRPRSAGGQGLVHRDVSPQNSLISFEGEVKLIDFGLALGGHGRPTTREGVVLGKLCYISPEQARAELLDRRTDIYSLGLVLFEMLVGEPFFNQPTVDEVMQHVACPDPQAPSERIPEIPEDIDRICLRALAADREHRYASAGELRDDLSAALARLAPRTNPEEVGAFVARLYPDAEAEEERLVSDLSGTLPPLPASPRQPPPGEAVASVAPVPAASLLAPAPAPVALDSALIPLEAVATLPAGLPAADAERNPALSATEPGAERRKRVISAITTIPAMKTPEAGEPPQRPPSDDNATPPPMDPLLAAQLEAWQRQGRQLPMGRMIAIAAILVLILASGVGILLYRHYSARRTVQHLDGLQLAMKRKKAKDAGAPVAPHDKGAPTVRTTKRNTGRSFCYIDFGKGKRGMRIYVNGKFRAKAPLSAPLPLSAGKRHLVEVRYRNHRSLRMRPECAPFQTYQFELQTIRWKR